MKVLLYSSLLIVCLTSCDWLGSSSGKAKEITLPEDFMPEPILLAQNGVKLIENLEEPVFQRSFLEIDQERVSQSNSRPQLHFEVSNFMLGLLTVGKTRSVQEVDPNGQHILMLDEQGKKIKFYSRDAELKVRKKKYKGFFVLCSSLNTVVKNDQAAVARTFSVKEDGAVEMAPFDEPVVRILPPPASVSGYDDQNGVLLDFVIINKNLKPGGDCMIKAHIDDMVFEINQYKSFWVYGLKPGMHKVKLVLAGKDGNKLEGSYTETKWTKFKIEE